MKNIPASIVPNDFKPCFRLRNYIVMTFSFVLVVIGFVLMCGPSCTMDAFNPEVFSIMRTVIAPTTCFVGYLLMVVGILL